MITPIRQGDPNLIKALHKQQYALYQAYLRAQRMANHARTVTSRAYVAFMMHAATPKGAGYKTVWERAKAREADAVLQASAAHDQWQAAWDTFSAASSR